jgi:signal transduction histidine kinase
LISLVLLLVAIVGGLWLGMRAIAPNVQIQGALFWVPLVTGCGSWLISGWVWAMRPDDLASRLFFFSGISILISALMAIPFYLENFSPPDSYYLVFYLANNAGASLFGIIVLILFFIYPVRLPKWRLMAGLVLAGFGGITLFLFTPFVPGWLTIHHVTLAEMLCIIGAVGVQYLASSQDPRARAILIWLGGAVLIGSGGFIFLASLPIVLGKPEIVPVPIAFGFFLIIYFGLAAGLRRFQLFALSEWAFQVLFYASAALALVVLDAGLILFLPVAKAPAFGISLLLIAFLYLPLRDRLTRGFFRQKSLNDSDILHAVIDVAFEPVGAKRIERWQGIMQQLFNPLGLQTAPQSVDKVQINKEGLEMSIPGFGHTPGLVVQYPWNGRGLFGPRHVRMTEQVLSLMQQAEAGREAYGRGVFEERKRIAQDMHDNIGAHLLGALHSSDFERKDTMIRETLTDLREIINNASEVGLSFPEMMADLRAECVDRLDASGIKLNWSGAFANEKCISSAMAHAIRSIIREALNNVIKHAGASQMHIEFSQQAGGYLLQIRDNGTGFAKPKPNAGNGLSNIENRVTKLGGDVAFETSDHGVSISIRLPKDTGNLAAKPEETP